MTELLPSRTRHNVASQRCQSALGGVEFVSSPQSGAVSLIVVQVVIGTVLGECRRGFHCDANGRIDRSF